MKKVVVDLVPKIERNVALLNRARFVQKEKFNLISNFEIDFRMVWKR